jgi:hypothetical protein
MLSMDIHDDEPFFAGSEDGEEDDFEYTGGDVSEEDIKFDEAVGVLEEILMGMKHF